MFNCKRQVECSIEHHQELVHRYHDKLKRIDAGTYEPAEISSSARDIYSNAKEQSLAQLELLKTQLEKLREQDE